MNTTPKDGRDGVGDVYLSGIVDLFPTSVAWNSLLSNANNIIAGKYSEEARTSNA